MASPPTFVGGGRADSCEDDSASFSSSASDSYSPNFYQAPRYRRQRTTSCRSLGSQNGASVGGGGRKTMIDKSQPKLCVICGDKAKGVNFNALTCMSCKAFFRRNALRNKEMKCPFQDRCSVDKITRKFCSKCRLKKCFDSGMKKEWILSEEEKLAIKEKIARNRARRQEESAGTPIGPSADCNGSRKRGRKTAAAPSATITLPDYSCDVLEGLEFVGGIDQQLSNDPASGNASGLEIFQNFQHGQLDSVQIQSQSVLNRASYTLQQGNQNQQSATQNQHSHPQGSGIFCLEPFDTLTISGNDPVFEWPTSSQNTDAGIVDSLTNDLNDCCQILFANDLFDSEVIKSEFLDIEQPSSSSDFSQYLLHGTDPNIQNGRSVPLLSCAQQFQQKQCSNTTNTVPPTRTRHVMSRLAGPDDSDAELPDFLSACLGSNNILQSRCESRDPACDLGVIYDATQQVPLPDDLAFLNTGLIQPEKELLAELSEACKALESPYLRMIDYERCESLRTSRITEHTLMRMITMSKKLSTFTKLPIQDRVKLLKSNLIEMLGIRSALFYIPDREAWSMINDDFKINVLIKMNVIRPFCTRAMWQRHKDFPSKFRNEWLRDTTIFDLLTVIVLFTTRANLTDQTRVLDEQMRYSYLLRRYLETKYACNTTSKEVYDLLMDCVKEMRELNGDIVNFFRGYHRLIGGSPLFTQILELPPTAECLERQNEILSALTEDCNIMNSSGDYCSSSSLELNTLHHHHLNHNHHHLHQSSVLFNGENNGPTIDLNTQKGVTANISTNNATVPTNAPPTSAQQNCFGILNSVN